MTCSTYSYASYFLSVSRYPGRNTPALETVRPMECVRCLNHKIAPVRCLIILPWMRLCIRIVIPVALLHRIFNQISYRINIQLYTCLHNCLTYQSRRLHVAISAEGTGRHMVGNNYFCIVFLIVCFTEDGKSISSHRQHEFLSGSTNACICNLIHNNCACQTVFLHTKFKMSLGNHTVLMDCKMLFFAVIKHNRTSGSLCHYCCKYERLNIAAV